jgi:CRISPR/Cas system CSM-associated protein Csm3 (group 7 of RAMP superfamily)
MLDYRQLQTRYRFEGTLTMETALHIGTGQISTVTDSPILRDAAGQPFIPGSSLKGAFRAAVARIVPNLGNRFKACDPFGNDDFCLSPQGGPQNKAYQALCTFLGGVLPAEGGGEDGEKARAMLEASGHRDWIGKEITENDLLTLLEENLCPVCQVFGSPFYAAKARFDDLPVKDWFQVTEVRDGVGIDRDTERAIEHIKYDFEVVPAGTTFKFGLTLENSSPVDEGLIAIGLREMEGSMVRLGGIRSRGLGSCRLTLEKIQHLNATDPKMLMAYLKGDDAGQVVPKEEFLSRAINSLFQGQEG